MTAVKVTALFVVFNALLSVGTGAAESAQAKQTSRQRGSQAAPHTTSRGPAQADHQWSADPERGWVRGDQADGAGDRRSATKQNHQSRGQSNGKGKRF